MPAEKLTFTIAAIADLGSKSLPIAKPRWSSDYDVEPEPEPELDISPNDVAVAIREAVEGMLIEVQGLPLVEASKRAEAYLSKLNIASSVSVEHEVHERDVPDHRGEHTTVPDRVDFSGSLDVVISTDDEAAIWALGLDQGEWDSALKEAADSLGVVIQTLQVSEGLAASLSQLCAQNQARYRAWQSVVDDISNMLKKTGDVLEPDQQVREAEAMLKTTNCAVEPKKVAELVQAIRERKDTPVDLYLPFPYQDNVKSVGVEIPDPAGAANRFKIK